MLFLVSSEPGGGEKKVFSGMAIFFGKVCHLVVAKVETVFIQLTQVDH